MTITLTPAEKAYLIQMLSGRLDMETKRLGEGMTGLGVLALRAKLEESK